jgi:alkylated DNA repair dioxygenase AlkB
MRVPLVSDAWLEHEPSWLDRAEADALLRAITDELVWEQRAIVLFGRTVMQPRLIAWAGDLGYRYSGQTLERRAFTPALARVRERVCRETGIPFNHVLANRYRNGLDSMGLHADDEPELGADPVVATVSLGATRRFVLRARRKSRDGSRALHLEHGSLLVMGGTCQRHYVHGVPRQPDVQDERVSLTFRWLQREPA